MKERFNGAMLAALMAEREEIDVSLAVHLGVTAQSVGRYRRGLSTPKLEAMLALVSWSGVPMPEWMTTERGRPTFNIRKHPFTIEGLCHRRRYSGELVCKKHDGTVVVRYTTDAGETHTLTASPKASGRGWLGIQDART